MSTGAALLYRCISRGGGGVGVVGCIVPPVCTTSSTATGSCIGTSIRDDLCWSRDCSNCRHRLGRHRRRHRANLLLGSVTAYSLSELLTSRLFHDRQHRIHVIPRPVRMQQFGLCLYPPASHREQTPQCDERGVVCCCYSGSSSRRRAGR